MSLFGTDGIRAEAGRPPLDDTTVFRIGRALGRILPEGRRRGVIGGDTRESTPGIVAALARGLAASNVAIENAGVIPTPGVATLVRERRTGFGISVSASHNPWRDNGIKLFGPDGRKYPDAGESEIERALASETGAPANQPVPPVDPALRAAYARRLLAAAPDRLDGLRVALDPGNGAAFEIAPDVIGSAGAAVEAIGNAPDGRNINAGCGAVHPEGLAARVVSGGLAMGAAFDGDADRVILADEHGRILDGDDVLWMLARDARSRGALDPPLVIGTVMTNFGLEQAFRDLGVELRRTPVGDKHVARAMQETGARLGGESSGHVILGDLSTTGDGILAALCVAALVVRSGAPLSMLADLRKAPQVLENVPVARRVPLDQVVRLTRAVADAEAELAGEGRVLLRYSGTEPLLRVMVEGTDRPAVERIAAHLGDVARRELGAGG